MKLFSSSSGVRLVYSVCVYKRNVQ